MSVCLLAIADGRYECHARSLASALEHLPKFDQYVLVDDRDHEQGFGGAIQTGWEQVRTDYVFHLEQDFLFNSSIPVERMIGVLERNPHLVQLALKRQPWNAEESAAGGIVECHPEDFTECSDGRAVWTTHRRFWTTNPAVYSSGWCRGGWPQVPQSEGVFTHKLIEDDPDLHFAFWGAKFDPPLVEHIGMKRAGHSY